LLDRLRAGAAGTGVRSLDDDVAATRRLYESYVATPNAVPTRRARLAAVVLNFRTAADTAIATGSLLASDRQPDDIIVVDNDADSACRNELARRGDAITYVQPGGNLGFSGGMNVGIRLALDRGADFVLLVNSDVVVPPDCIGQLEAALAARPDTGIAGPLVLSRSLPDVVGSSGVDYNRGTGRMRHRGVGAIVDSAKNLADAEVDAVSGCLMLVARNVFDRVGLLDERYFFSFEEIDFCLRARAAGIGTRLVGGAVAYHEGGQAIGGQAPRRLYFAARNHLLLAQAHAVGGLSVKRAARALFIVALNLAHAVRTSGGSLPARLGATLRGIRDHLEGRYGNDRAA
jgi:GT2 family glycosyltransferase